MSLVPLETPNLPSYNPEDDTASSVEPAPIESRALSEGGNLVEAEWFIRAAQGHSLPTVTTEHLVPVQDDEEGRANVGEMVHGTKEELWEVIREYGNIHRTWLLLIPIHDDEFDRRYWAV